MADSLSAAFDKCSNLARLFTVLTAAAAARLDGAWMRGFSPYHVHTAFGIESKVEEELQPGITISKPVSTENWNRHLLVLHQMQCLVSIQGCGYLAINLASVTFNAAAAAFDLHSQLPFLQAFR